MTGPDLLGLCCAACVAFGDPTHVLGAHDGVRVEGLAATTFRWLSEPVSPPGDEDGFHLQQARLSLAGDATDEIAFYGALGASDQALDQVEAYGDAVPVEGLRIRAGRWLQGLGMVSGRRVEQRCFADVPLHTARFLAPEGLYDQGVQLGYLAPVPAVPIWIGGSILHGQSGASFGPPAAAGEGTDVFERLLYVVRVVAFPGKAFGQHVAVGFTFATGENATGPDNRTDLIGADASTVFSAGGVRIGANVEYLMRRYSIPDALYVEGGLNADVVVGYEGFHGGVRMDLMGLPEPPDRARLDYRVTVMAGFSVTDLVRFRLQYAARNDTPGGELGHEVLAQAIVGVGATFGGEDPPAPPPSSKPVRETGWEAAAADDLAAAQTLADAGRHAAAVQHAQQAAYEALRARAPSGDVPPSAVAVLEGFAERAPERVWAAARELDRMYVAARQPSGLGAPERLFDAEASRRAIGLAETITQWVAEP